ncbi:MAG: hypothetical protein ACREA9_02600, partial [Pyrinomonadaceae bacterium]
PDEIEKMIELRREVAKNLVESCRVEHKDASGTFAALDTKAQNTIMVAGIFMAGALAFFRGDVLQQLVAVGSRLILVLLGLAVLTLILAITLCIYAMVTREVSISEPRLFEEQAQVILNEPPDLLSDLYERYLFYQANHLNDLSSEIRKVNNTKATAIKSGQVFLAIATLFVALLLFYTLYAVWHLGASVKAG